MTKVLGPEMRLATYGTLAPGRANHHQLDGLSGTWSTGFVRGRLVEEGWGAAMGYPALILDDTADGVEVFVFTSEDLPDHWDRLDAFEGDGYQRGIVTVETDTAKFEAYLYLLAETGQ